MDTNAAAANWDIGAGVVTVEDELLKQPVLEHSSDHPASLNGWIQTRAALTGSYEVVAQIRAMQAGGWRGVVLSCGANGPGNTPSAAYGLSAYAGLGNWMVEPRFGANRDACFKDIALLRDATTQARTYGTMYCGARYRKVSALSEEAYRREIESAIGTVAVETQRWVELRIAVQGDGVRLYFDGVLAAERRPAGRVNGRAHLKLSRRVRVASLVVRRLADEPGPFQPIALTERLNACATNKAECPALSPDALPPAGSKGTVGDVPFEFSERPGGRDHVDLSQSLFRFRNRSGAFMAGGGADNTITWPAPWRFDPGRIMFMVPNRAYTRLWLVVVHDERPFTVPTVTVRFFSPGNGFPIDAAAEVPALTATSAPDAARPLSVRLGNGGKARLWLVPIELDAARIGSELRNEPVLAMELTKGVYPHRDYPDPCNYGWYQGGLPSGARVFAATLEEAPVRLIARGNRHGHAYVAPEQPVWQVALANQTAGDLTATIRVCVTDPYGAKAGVYERSATLAPRGHSVVEVPLTARVNGLHTVVSEVGVTERSDRGWGSKTTRLSRPGAFVQLPPDTRKATKDNSPWGIFNWGGGHGTHVGHEEDLYLTRAAGARHGVAGSRWDAAQLRKWGVRPSPAQIGNDFRSAAPWSFEDPQDPKKYAEFRDMIGKRVAEMLQKQPDVPSVSMFTETAISYMLTYGVPPQYLGEGPYEYSDEEAKTIRAFLLTGKAVCEGIRQHAPKAKIALGWAEPILTPPLLREGFPREYYDLIGVDTPVFERIPEGPIREVAPNRMWLLSDALKELKLQDVPIIHTESYYPSSNPLALGARRSADHYVRLAVLSLAMAPRSILANCFSLQDCGSYWGSQHYGEHGLLAREPEANPKPAFAAFATMTRLLDPPGFVGYVPTGSRAVYAVHFTSNNRNVYCLWTMRGTREATVSFEGDGEAVLVDESGNETPLPNAEARIPLSATPVWVASPKRIKGIVLGAPVYTERPGENVLVLDPLEKAWTYESGPYDAHAQNHWGCPRHDGPMCSEIVQSEERKAPVWQITLDEPAVKRELTAWYGVFKPYQPLTIPGKARALGVWANGHANWGRIVYEVEDAKGEVWRSTGTKDDWNCDDIHAWSFFNFDGWRWIEFPLPGNLPYDNYRDHETVWWGAEGGDHVVDLPLKLRSIVIEHRTHNIYVNELVAETNRSIQLSRLTAVYDDAPSMTDAPVHLQQATADALRWKTDGSALPNPIATLRGDGGGEPTAFESLAPPEGHDRLVTRLDIRLRAVEGAKEYRLYAAAYESGAGGEVVARGAEPLLKISGLPSGNAIYLFATYTDAAGKEAKPTAARRLLLQDEFPFK